MAKCKVPNCKSFYKSPNSIIVKYYSAANKSWPTSLVLQMLCENVLRKEVIYQFYLQKKNKQGITQLHNVCIKVSFLFVKFMEKMSM